MKYYGQFSNPSVDEYLHKTFFPNKTNGFYIECGAADGIYCSSCKFFHEIGWKGINIEADPELFTSLTYNRPKEHNIHAALTSKKLEGKIEFTPIDFKEKYIQKHPSESWIGNKTVLGFAGQKNTKIKENKTFDIRSSIIVPSISYSSLIDKYNISNVDLFVLDVEGGEKQVIEGMYATSVLPKVLCVETLPTGLNVLKQILQPLGYKYFSEVHANVHFILS